jgi:hypothetical protein
VWEGQGHGSPHPPDIRQYNEFMNRELPKLLRKTWQSTLESSFGPLEETLKHQLVSVVKDVHESLTRNYFTSTQSSTSCATKLAELTDKEDTDRPLENASGDVVTDTPETVESSHLNSTQTSILSLEMIGLAETEQSTKPSNVTNDSFCIDVELPNCSGSSTLSQYFLPPDVECSSTLQIPPTKNTAAHGTSSDSTCFSIGKDEEQAYFDEVWWQQMLNKSVDDIIFEYDLNEGAVPNSFAPEVPFVQQNVQTYTGKGKGRTDAAPDFLNFGTWELGNCAKDLWDEF